MAQPAKECREILSAAQKAGWKTRAGKGHYVLYPPGSRSVRPFPIQMGKTTSNTAKRQRSRLRKLGLPV